MRPTSGAMYLGVPQTVPTVLPATMSASTALLTPKSASLSCCRACQPGVSAGGASNIMLECADAEDTEPPDMLRRTALLPAEDRREEVGWASAAAAAAAATAVAA